MRLSNRATFALLASIVIVFLSGSSAPTPLYPIYQAAWGFSPIAVSVVFGIYAIAVLSTLLVFGALSDYVGRRPVLLVTALVEIAAMIVFMTAHGLGALLAARIVQGLGVGAAAAAAGAGMLDLDRERGTIANAAAPGLGTASGALLSGLFVQLLPSPTTLVYGVLAAVLLAQAIAVCFMPETTARKPGALAALRPRIRVPSELRLAVLLAAPALVAAWALAGFYGSLGPALVRRVLGSNAPVLGGLAMFALGASGAATVLVVQRLSTKITVRFGTLMLIVGVASVLCATFAGSMTGFFTATVIAGIGFGASFQGGMRSVLANAAPAHRAGVLSVLYAIAYLSLSVPALAAGLRVVHGGGLVGTAYEFGAVVIALAAAAFAGSFVVAERKACPRLGESCA
jgi:predicted MFS family arabinose efflux permease